jgi:hypothetical protein
MRTSSKARSPEARRKQERSCAYIIVARTGLVAEKRRLERLMGRGWDEKLSQKLDCVIEALRILEES